MSDIAHLLYVFELKICGGKLFSASVCFTLERVESSCNDGMFLFHKDIRDQGYSGWLLTYLDCISPTPSPVCPV